MSNIYIVHPDDSNLKFFAKTIKTLKFHFDAEYLFLGPDNSHHEACLNALKGKSSATIIFFCHGEGKSLRGCNRESSQRRPYVHGAFISPTKNMDVFENKKVFCMACSSSSLGADAINAGAKVFLGFGNVRFNNEQKMKNRVIAFTKFEIRKLIQESLFTAILENQSFNQLSKNLRYLINKRRNELLLSKKHDSRKKYDPYLARQASIVLASLGRGIVLFGDSSQKVG